MPILEDVKNAGWPGLVLLLFGVLGILLSGIALALVAARARAAFLTGLAALGLAAVILFGGALGTMHGRRITEEALAGGNVSEIFVEQIRRAGYEEARSASKLGLLFGAAPFVMGAIAAFSGARRNRKKEAPEGVYARPGLVPEAEEGGTLGAPLALFGLNLMGIAAASLFLVAPLPGHDELPTEEPPPAAPVESEAPSEPKHVQADVTVEPPQSPQPVQGSLPPAEIQRVIRRHLNRMRACYEKGLQRSPGLEGTVKVRFTIGPTGAVTTAKSEGSSMPDPEVVSCVVKIVLGLTFSPTDGGPVTVVYPFTFKAAE